MKNEKRCTIFTREFKLNFLGYGDWLDEEDTIEFEYRGFLCMIYRVVKREPYAPIEAYFGGHFCGYIFLPEDHPLYGKKPPEIDLDCHGGVTHAEPTEKGWMVGFDCGHSGDIIPTMQKFRGDYIKKELEDIFPIPEELKKCSIFNPTYKNMDFCIRECKSMAKQASKMSLVNK